MTGKMGLHAAMMDWNLLIMPGLSLFYYAVGFLGLYVRVRLNR